MKKMSLIFLLLAPFISTQVMAEAGDIVVRVRAVHVATDNDSKLGSFVPALGAGAQLEASDNTIPEIDFSYYVTKNIALELIAGTSRHNVSIINSPAAQGISSVNLLPPTLTAQWHFMPDQTFDPYVGAGLNYTRFTDNKLNSTLGAITTDRNSFGVALQAGVDVNLKDGWMLNADVKKIWVSTDVKLGATKIDSLDIDPWLFGVGVGKRF